MDGPTHFVYLYLYYLKSTGVFRRQSSTMVRRRSSNSSPFSRPTERKPPHKSKKKTAHIPRGSASIPVPERIMPPQQPTV
jgi:hypothetical protein